MSRNLQTPSLPPLEPAPKPAPPRDGEARYRTLVESAFDLVCECDLDGVYRYLGPNYSDILGYTPEELMGTSLFANVHPDDLPYALAARAGFLQQGTVRTELRYRHRNGQWLWLESSARLIPGALDEAGGALAIIVSRDITERKRREQELAMLVSLAQAVNTQTELPSIAEELARHLRPLIPFDSLGISLLDGPNLQKVAEVSLPSHRSGFLRMNRAEHTEWEVWPWLESQRVHVENRWDYQRHAPGSWVRAFINVPLVTVGQTLGLLHLDSAQPDVYTDEHAHLAERVGQQVAVAVRQARLLQEARGAEERQRAFSEGLRAVARIADELLACPDVDTVCRRGVELGREGLGLERCGIFLAEADGETMCGTYGTDPEGNTIDESDFRRSRLSEWLAYLEHRQPDEPRWLVLDQPDQNWTVLTPIQTAGRPIGAFFNDAALSGTPLDETQQEIVVIYCSLLGTIIERKRVLATLRDSETRYRTLTESGAVGIWQVTPDGHTIYINPAMCRMLEISEAQELEGQTMHHFFTPAGLETIRPEHAKRLQGIASNYEVEIVGAQGGRRSVVVSGAPISAPDGTVTSMIGTFTDITERKRAEAALVQSNAILQATQEAAADGICLVDGAGQIVSFNHRFVEMWGIPATLTAPAQRAQLMQHLLARLKDPDEFVQKLGFLLDHPAASSRDEIALRDGRVFERYSAPALGIDDFGLTMDNSRPANRPSPIVHRQSYGRVWSFSDLTESKRYESQLAHQAFHDPLTGLPNRALFVTQLEHALSRLDRSGKLLAVMFLDLDRFKVVNDSLGHEYGDRLLVKVAGRIKACLRPSDSAARFGGDEFTILLEDIAEVADATHVAERIAEALQSPFSLIGHEVYTSTSIGIVLCGDARQRVDELLRNADIAMYRAKGKGPAQHEVFDAALSAFTLERLQLEIDLRQAIKKGELLLHYQPVVDLRRGRIRGVEALLRWRHPRLGLVPPAEFISMAEDTGMILPIGQWVLREACTQTLRWQQELGLAGGPKGGVEGGLELSVNLSAKQFQQQSLTLDISRILEEIGLDASCLKLEITESVMMEGAESTIAQLGQLKQLGVQLAIDDFGTGYSSLSYLKRFPLDALKIDRSLISRLDGAGSDDEDTAILQAVHTLGHALHLEVTAEGIETAVQLAHLRSLGCHLGQGYFFSTPLSAAEITRLLKTNPQW